MTSEDHAELSAQVARAIGWKLSHITASGEVHVELKRGSSRRFDYRSPDVCLELVKWLGKEHAVEVSHDPLHWSAIGPLFRHVAFADDYELAVARAVLAVAKEKA